MRQDLRDAAEKYKNWCKWSPDVTVGEIFRLKELADDCAADKVYEFPFVAPALPVTGAGGSPINPLAIK